MKLGFGSDMCQEVLSLRASVSHLCGGERRLSGSLQALGCALKGRKCFLILPNPGTHAHRTLPRCAPGHPEALEDSTASSLSSEWRPGRELGSHSWGLNSCVNV